MFEVLLYNSISFPRNVTFSLPHAVISARFVAPYPILFMSQVAFTKMVDRLDVSFPPCPSLPSLFPATCDESAREEN